ncbi:hypothetical protein OQA88_875 [Cercophora sp. LCS_1]
MSANPERPLGTVFLAVDRGERRLQFYRQADGSLRIADVTTLLETQQQTIRETLINLAQDSIVPLYTINGREPRTGYEIQVNYWSGQLPVIYRLRDRREALRFQRLVTGWRTKEHFDQTSCSVVFRATGWPLRRDKELAGRGEVQFLAPARRIIPAISDDGLHPVASSRSVPSSPIDVPVAARRMSVVTTHSDTRRNRQVVVSSQPPEPILVAFFQGDDYYTMLKIKVREVELRPVRADCVVELSPRGSPSTFMVDSLSVSNTAQDLAGWNVCELMKKGNRKNVKQLKCTNLTLGFRDLELLENFERRFLFVYLQWAKAANEQLAILMGMNKGRMPIDSFPTSPSSSSIPRIPTINIPDISNEAWRELEAEMRLRELDADSDSLPGIPEMGDGAE